jgi:D-psicose/D-tagatose/L-ribulose 3-epimerase
MSCARRSIFAPSGAQRRVAGPDDAKRAEEAWSIAAASAQKAEVVYCLEPLAKPDCNFVNTLAEAAEVVKRIANPAFRTMVDTLAASLMEPEPVADAIRRWQPTGLMAHIQLNDRNKRGPGQGADRFAPVIAALRDTGYDGWVAMEPFIYEPDGPTCAARMIGYVAGLLE